MIDRFWKKVSKSDGCWTWSGTKNRHGYGMFSVDGHMRFAHRVSYEITSGAPVPAGAVVMHSCDNPSCVKPDHLTTGSQADNIRDRDRKARGFHLTGEAHPNAKLTFETAEDIRRIYAAGGVTMKALGAQFGVSKFAVQSVISERTYPRPAARVQRLIRAMAAKHGFPGARDLIAGYLNDEAKSEHPRRVA